MKTLQCAAILLAFVGLLLAGCADKAQPPVSPATNTGSVAPSLMKGNGSGAVIWRYNAEMWWGFLDSDAHLMLIIGINDLQSACGGQGGFDLFKNMDIYLPGKIPDLARVMTVVKGRDVTAVVWQTDSWPDDLCDFLLNNEPLAVGTANFMYTDNDFYAYEDNHKNTNAFGYRANGTLTGADGRVYKLNLVDRVMWDGVDGTKFNEVLKIQLTPTGGK